MCLISLCALTVKEAAVKLARIFLFLCIFIAPFIVTNALARAADSPLLLETPSATVRPTDTRWPTATVRPTDTRWPTVTRTPTRTATSTITPSITRTPSVTPTFTITRTPTVSPTPSITRTPTLTLVPSATLTPTLTRTPTATAIPIAPIQLLYPNGDAIPQTIRPVFDWTDIPGGTLYNIVISRYSSFVYPLVNTTTSASSYTPTADLPRNTLLYWRVRLISPVYGSWSATSFTSPNPPYTPAMVSPAANALVTGYTPKLDWSPSSLPIGTIFSAYQIQVDDNSDFSSPFVDYNETNSANHAFTFAESLKPNSKYYWRVRTLNTLGQSSLWASRSFRTALPAPDLIPVVLPHHLRPTFEWNDVPGATGYGIVISAYADFSLPVVSTAVSSSSYTPIIDLPRNRTIYWRVRAQGTNISAWSTSSFLSPNPPNPIAMLAPARGALVNTLTPTLDWAAAVLPSGTSFAYYEFELDNDPDFSSPLITKTDNNLANHVYRLSAENALAANNTYYWRVRAFNMNAQFSTWNKSYFKTYSPTATPTPRYTNTPTPTATSLPGPIVDFPHLRQLNMIDAFNGWGITETAILRTVDGGLHWFDVTMPATDLTGLAISSKFLDATTGWVVTNQSETGPGSLYRTTDGGQSWSRYEAPFGGGYIRFSDPNHGYVLTITGAAMSKQSVALYKTDTGGANWTLQYYNDPTIPGYSNTLPLGGHKNGLTFHGSLTGWVGGDTPSPGFVYLYKSTDFGVSWVQTPLALPGGYEQANIITTEPTFFGANDGVLPVWMGLTSGHDLFIYTTHDGGSTWSYSTSSTHNAESILFVSLNDAFGWDWNGTFHVTHNGGASWNIVTPDVNFASGFRGMDFVSTSTGWVLMESPEGYASLYRTTDGGFHWTALYTTPPTATPTPSPSPAAATVQSIDIQIVEGQPLQAYATIHGFLPDDGCTTIASVNQIRTGSTFTLNISTTLDTIAQCNHTPTAFERSETLYTSNLPVGVYTVTSGGVSQDFELVTQDLARFNQAVVDALNVKDFSTAQILMDQSFVFAYWQSQGAAYPASEAIAQLQANYIGSNTTLTADPNKDLTTLLGGSDPYAIMGLNPAESQALFVSGWGLDGKAEAILYAARLANGAPYWNSVLIAPGGFLGGTGPYMVMFVAPNDVLNIRSAAGVSNPIIATLPPNAVNILGTGGQTSISGDTWFEIQKPEGGTGWVNAYYLTEQVSQPGFAADTRPKALLNTLKAALNNQNGSQLASLVHPKHGLAILYSRYASPISFTPQEAAALFTSTAVINWGPIPGAGTNLYGTFNDAIRPKLLDVFNASYDLFADQPKYLEWMPNPWPYTAWHYYNVYRYGTPGVELDWRAWLVGFEYIDSQPYLTVLLHYQWEP